MRRCAPGAALLAIGLGLGCHAVEGDDTPPSETPPPNLLLITVDTLRWDHCSFHGHANDTTPGLARLAAESAVFETAYAPSSTTAPTHATILTGLYPPSHGVRKNAIPLDAAHETLAERLSRRGYQTAAVVSSFVLDRRFQWDQGFDVYRDDFPEETSSARPERWEGLVLRGGFDRRAAATTRLAQRWLWERDRARPFFLFVHYFDPHSPYDPPEPYRRRFPAPPASGRPERDAPGVREQIRRYDGEIAYADRAIAELLQVLAREGLEERTLVAITADHGEGLLDHGFVGHGTTLYEEVVRVPLLLRWPGAIPPQRLAAPVGLVDLLPTLLELLGLPPDGGLQGRSLAAALRGEAPLETRRPVYLVRRPYAEDRVEGRRVDGELTGIRIGSWKYIEGEAEARAELYHLERDPGERLDLHDSHPERAALLAAQLAAWRAGQREERPLPAISEEDRRALEALGYVE